LFNLLIFKRESEFFLIIAFEPVNINSVLATFRLSFLAINHFLRFSKSEFTAVSRSVIKSPEAVRFVSSAKNRGFVLFRYEVLFCLDVNHLYIIKRIVGPKIEPCGTPHLVNRSVEKEFLIWHF
jgi:hypothetical protein